MVVPDFEVNDPGYVPGRQNVGVGWRPMDVDYDQISETYDDHRHGGGPCMEALVAAARASGGDCVLELGAGTGNNTAALLDRFPCRLIALEPSRGMAARGRAKGLPVYWLRGVGECIPLANGSVDFIFGAYMLHYIRDLNALFSECRRVLRGGRAVFVTVPRRFIANHPLRGYFPSLPEVDLARFQPVETVVRAMEEAGFVMVTATVEASPPRPVDAAYVRKIAGKLISTYELLPPGEFESGLKRLKADLARPGKPAVTVHREAVAIAGCVQHNAEPH